MTPNERALIDAALRWLEVYLSKRHVHVTEECLRIACEALLAERAETIKEDTKMDEKTLQEAVNRFLAWKLPADFCPDCGISFDGRGKDAMGYEKTWPVGTNLLTADQARAMFEHCFRERAEMVATERIAQVPYVLPDNSIEWRDMRLYRAADGREEWRSE